MARTVKMNREGVKELLKSKEVLDFLMSIADDVARDAGDGVEAKEWMRPSRAVANVVDTREGAMFIESQQGNLARAAGKSRG